MSMGLTVRILLVGFATAVSLSLPSTAQAAQGETFNALVKQAIDAYREAKYQEAVDIFERAYAIRPKPELVYNIARSHEKGLRTEQAIEAYERFLGLPGTTAELRAKALEALAALRREQVARRATLEPPAQEVAQAPAPAASTLGSAPTPRVDRTVEWALIGGGAAVAAAGGVLGILALDSDQELEDARNSGASRARLEDLSSETERNALLADVLIGVGAASAVAGVVLFLVRGDSKPAPVAVQPQWINGGGGLVVGGAF